MRRLLILVFALALAAPALTRAQAPSPVAVGTVGRGRRRQRPRDSVPLRDRRQRRGDQRIVLQRRREGDVDRRQVRERIVEAELRSLRDGSRGGARRTAGSPASTTAPPASIRSTRSASRRRRRSRTKCRQIDGLWTIGDVNSNKGESAWRFIVRQSGAEVTAAILRVDGDTGALSGTFRNGKFIVSHFSGARPLVLELTPQKDGSLEILRNRTEKMVAVRDTEAKLKGVAEPTDPSRHSSVKDPTEPFKFAFPDITGKIALEHRRALPRQGRDRQHQRQLVPELPRRSAVPRRALQEVPREGTRDRRALVRRRIAEGEGLSAPARVQQALRHRTIRSFSPVNRPTSRRRCRRSTT